MSAEAERTEPLKEFGFGRGANETGIGLLNRDGGFNVIRKGQETDFPSEHRIKAEKQAAVVL